MSVFISASIVRYFEPFLGSRYFEPHCSGALFFWLNNRGIKFEAYLYDINNELINAYKIVVSRVEELIEDLEIYEKQYRQNPQFFYCQLRDSPLEG
jgi:DNA adenine methylase